MPFGVDYDLRRKFTCLADDSEGISDTDEEEEFEKMDGLLLFGRSIGNYKHNHHKKQQREQESSSCDDKKRRRHMEEEKEVVKNNATTKEEIPDANTTSSRGSNNDIDEEESNLTGLEPHVGMSLEIRDPDYIWSSATIESIVHGDTETRVIIGYEGWGSEWNETLPWPHARLAKLFTYTRRVKSLVHLLSPTTKSRPAANVSPSSWPCRVSFRMPHPFVDDDDPRQKRAEELLQLESKVFVQPYCKESLPSYVTTKLMHNDGFWLEVNKLRKWRTDLHFPESTNSPKPFAFAYLLAMQDQTTIGTYPSQVLDTGTLLKTPYRVRTLGGSGMLTGDLETSKPAIQVLDLCDTTSNSIEDNASAIDNAPTPKPIQYEAPPTLPPPVVIDEPADETTTCYLENSKRWARKRLLNGNHVFLGFSPTQTGTHYEDMKQTSLEKAIAALEQHPKEFFSLHEWSMQQIRRQGYLRQIRVVQRQKQTNNNMSTPPRRKSKPTKSRKKSIPMKVNLQKKKYIPTF